MEKDFENVEFGGFFKISLDAGYYKSKEKKKENTAIDSREIQTIFSKFDNGIFAWLYWRLDLLFICFYGLIITVCLSLFFVGVLVTFYGRCRAFIVFCVLTTASFCSSRLVFSCCPSVSDAIFIALISQPFYVIPTFCCLALSFS